jgi:hypothetical protein
MPPADRKGNLHFEALWTFPVPQSILPIVTSNMLHEVDSALKCELLLRKTRPPYLRSADLKYKLSDLEAVLNISPITLHVTGYIQSDLGRAIDSENLLR